MKNIILNNCTFIIFISFLASCTTEEKTPEETSPKKTVAKDSPSIGQTLFSFIDQATPTSNILESIASLDSFDEEDTEWLEKFHSALEAKIQSSTLENKEGYQIEMFAQGETTDWKLKKENGDFILEKTIAPEHIYRGYFGHQSCMKPSYWTNLNKGKKVTARVSKAFKDCAFPLVVEITKFQEDS